MKFVDTHQDIFSSIEITTYANQDGVYSRYDGLNNNNIWTDPENMGIGDVNLVNNGAVLTFNVLEGEDQALYEATGTYDPEEGTTAFNSANRVTDTSGPVSLDIWESSYVPTSNFGTASGKQNEDGTTTTMLEMTSFYATQVEEDGSTTYYSNHFGPDTNYSYNENYASMGAVGTNFFILYNVNVSFGFWTMVYFGDTGFIYDYVTTAWNLSADGGTLTYVLDFNYSSTIHYSVTITMTDVGTDSMPQEAKDIISQTAGV